MKSAKLVAPATLVVLSLLTRLPPLLNASGTNSDAAIVGLQARHILHGEWSPFLWGSGYQTSADSTWAALFFVVSKSPFALMLSALSLHVALTLFVYSTLRRHIAFPWHAFVAALPLVFTTACIHSYALYPPRQLALTVAFAALWAIDRGGIATLVLGGLLTLLAPAADPYAMIFVPAAFLLAIIAVLRSRESLGARGCALAGYFGGVLLGGVSLALLLGRPQAQQGVVTMSAHVIGHNAKLLWHECLPWAIGTKVYKPLHVMDYVPWKMPTAYRVFAYAGAASLGVSLLVSLGLAFRRACPPGAKAARAARALAAIAFVTIVLNVGSFLVSLMVMDQFSMRYLAASLLVLPFALAPLVERLGARASFALAPYLASALAAGWLAHGNWVHGPLPVRTDAGRGLVESRVLTALRQRKVEAATADYWSAYRLDLLWNESIPVVPFHPEQDRYAPYRVRFSSAKRFAYIHDRDRSFEDPVDAAAQLASGNHIIDRFTWDTFDVTVFERD